MPVISHFLIAVKPHLFHSRYNLMRLGEMIRAWRDKNHVSRRTLATEIGIDHVTLSRIENNDCRAIAIDNLNKIFVWMTGTDK
jgi:transcriptional regulator with XRE-family HTH domain